MSRVVWGFGMGGQGVCEVLRGDSEWQNMAIWSHVTMAVYDAGPSQELNKLSASDSDTSLTCTGQRKSMTDLTTDGGGRWRVSKFELEDWRI